MHGGADLSDGRHLTALDHVVSAGNSAVLRGDLLGDRGQVRRRRLVEHGAAANKVHLVVVARLIERTQRPAHRLDHTRGAVLAFTGGAGNEAAQLRHIVGGDIAARDADADRDVAGEIHALNDPFRHAPHVAGRVDEAFGQRDRAGLGVDHHGRAVEAIAVAPDHVTDPRCSGADDRLHLIAFGRLRIGPATEDEPGEVGHGREPVMGVGKALVLKGHVRTSAGRRRAHARCARTRC
ncbi:Uncharacterised protein [Starkeya nomas]|uniref:Uncharacterized protein n=1 Tax=Starkeya nomas TaxID=2666134 RepID=A0A5S9R481_9HYPH|nr:Uncharacterised protein [Starkeya nomas]